MNTAGKVVRTYSGEKTIYVFGLSEVPLKIGSYSTTEYYHVGINLDTGKVDDINQNDPLTVQLNDLTEKQQLILAGAIKQRLSLQRNVLAISAKARSGKDYVSDYVRSTFNKKLIDIKALADPIRYVRNLLFGEPPAGVKDRAPLIMIGQALRGQDPNIWNKVWLRNAIEDLNRTENRAFICQDVRQPSEFSFFKSLGALTVKVEADEEKRLNKIREVDGEAALDAKLLNDETESHVGGFNADITVTNNYDEQFIKDVDFMVVTALIERGW